MMVPGKPLRSRAITPAALFVIIGLLWLATGLRFYRLDDQSFWNDEGNSARLSERSPLLIIEGTASDVHPPLYYLLLRGWREFLGGEEFGLRAFSAFAGLLTVAAVMALASLLGGSWRVPLVLLAGLLAALNPALIYYSQETRMYALLALLAALATAALWRWLTGLRRWPWALAYVLLAAAGLYTHYFFPAVLAVHAVVVLLWFLSYVETLAFNPLQLVRRPPGRETLLGFALLLGTALLLYAPWVPIFWRQVGGRPGTEVSAVQFGWQSLRWMAFGETVEAGTLLLPGLAIGLLVLWSVATGRRRSAIPLLGTTIPVVLMVVAGSTAPAFYKFLLAAVPFFILLLSVGLARLGARDRSASWWSWLAGALLLALVLGGTAVSLRNLYTNPAFARADYRGMAARIAAEGHPNAGVILNAPNQWEVFTYYHRDGAPVYPLPRGQPEAAVVEPELEKVAGQHDRLYVLFWGDAQRDPQGIVERWLDRHMFQVSEEWVGDVRFAVYAVPERSARNPQTVLDARFGEAILLRGFSGAADGTPPGSILQLTLYWEALGEVEGRYKVFLHLLDEQGNLVAQRDVEPVAGEAPTDSWQPGEVVVDRHGLLLPKDLAPGTYTLWLGLYEAADPRARLTVEEPGSAGDALLLETVDIE